MLNKLLLPTELYHGTSRTCHISEGLAHKTKRDISESFHIIHQIIYTIGMTITIAVVSAPCLMLKVRAKLNAIAGVCL